MSLERREADVVVASSEPHSSALVASVRAVAQPVTRAAAPVPRVSAVVPARTEALQRVQALARQIVPRLQYRIAQLGPAGQAGLAALTAAAAVAVGALVPAYQALQTLSADLARAQHPSAAASLEQAVPRLVAALPTRAQMPAVLGQVFAEATTAGVPLESGHYAYTPAKSGAVARYELEFPVKATGYPQIRTFINRTLTVVPAAQLDKLHIERKAVGDQTVSADIGFIVFVRSGDAP